MGVKTGVDGFIQLSTGSSPICDINSWELNLSSNNQSYGSSCTAGHTSTTKGRLSGTFSVEAWLNTDDPIYDQLKPGQQITLWLYEDGTRRWVVPCRIGELSESVPIGDANIISVTLSGEAHGAWTYPDGTVSS